MIPIPSKPPPLLLLPPIVLLIFIKPLLPPKTLDTLFVAPPRTFVNKFNWSKKFLHVVDCIGSIGAPHNESSQKRKLSLNSNLFVTLIKGVPFPVNLVKIPSIPPPASPKPNDKSILENFFSNDIKF